MSLNFDLTAVEQRLGEERYNEVTTSLETRNKPVGEQKWHLVTNSLIWLTMGVGLGTITEDNIGEWSFRIALLGKLHGAEFRFADGREVHLTEQDLRNHIGLRTNVSTEKRAAWVKRTVEGAAYRLKLDSGEPEAGLAMSAGEQIDLIQRELLSK